MRHRCYLLGFIIHNPHMAAPPMVHRIQLASSETITMAHSLRGCTVTLARLMVTDGESYHYARERMVRWINGEYCPRWIKDRIQFAENYDFDAESQVEKDSQAMRSRQVWYNDHVATTQRSREVEVQMTRPYYTFAGEIPADMQVEEV